VGGFATTTLTFSGNATYTGTKIDAPGGAWLRPAQVTVVNPPAAGSGDLDIAIFSTNLSTADYTWRIDSTSGQAGNYRFGKIETAVTEGPIAYWPLTTAGPITTSPIPWNETRVVAAQVDVHNVTAYMSKGGTVMATRLLAEDQPTTGGLPSQYNWSEEELSQSNPQDLLFTQADSRLTGFCMPPSAELGFLDYIITVSNQHESGTQNVPIFRLDDTRPFLAMSYNFPDKWALAVTLTIHMEFRNARNLFQLGVSEIPMQTMVEVARRLADQRPFHSGTRPLLDTLRPPQDRTVRERRERRRQKTRKERAKPDDKANPRPPQGAKQKTQKGKADKQAKPKPSKSK
jgi:hypothetical protein